MARPSDFPTGLIGYWKFNNDPNDSSTGGNNLTPVNSPTYTLEDPRNGGEYSADIEYSSDQCFTGADDPVFDLNTGGYTIAAWGKAESLGSQRHFIFHKGDYSFNGYGLELSISGYLNLTVNNVDYTSTSSIVQIGEWSHLGVTFSGTTTTIYYKGNVDAVISSTNPLINNVAFRVAGRSDAVGTCWDGLLEDVGVWNVALTPAQMLQLADSGGGTSPSDFIYQNLPLLGVG